MRRADGHQDGDNQSVRTQKGVQALTDYSKIRVTTVPTILYKQDVQGGGTKDLRTEAPGKVVTNVPRLCWLDVA